MTSYKYKGKRIRASDKSLVFRFSVSILLPVFIVLLLALNSGQLVQTDWKAISLQGVLPFALTPYHFITVADSLGICLIMVWLYYHFCFDRIKQLQHRQKLAQMILQNHWYEAETVQESSFFTDLSSCRSRGKITSFPRCGCGLIHQSGRYCFKERKTCQRTDTKQEVAS